MTDRQTDRQTDSCRINIGTIDFEELANILNKSTEKGQKVKTAILMGMLTKDNLIKANIPSEDRSMFSQEKYKFFLYAPFEISQKCCGVMKKSPSHTYIRETGRKPITAQMASESRLRLQKWLQNGCNAFNSKNPISNPMSFWDEQDVYKYLKNMQDEMDQALFILTDRNNKHPKRERKHARRLLQKHNYRTKVIADVYGDIVVKDNGLQGQVNIHDYLNDYRECEYCTTGLDRTGCMFCGYGCHLENTPNRFERMAITHPKQFDYVMRGGAFADDGLWKPSNEGLGYWFVIKWINIHGNLNMAIPNYEHYEKKYGNEMTHYYLYEI